MGSQYSLSILNKSHAQGTAGGSKDRQAAV